LKLLLIIHMIVYILLVIREWSFLKVTHHIHEMYFQDIFNIKREERARIPWEFYIDFYL
jgi:hypothetical protein